MNEQYINFLAEELQKGKLVIFIGAGVSMNSGLPSWNSLVKIYAEYLGIKKEYFTSEEILEIPEMFYKEFGKIKYYEILEKVFKGNYETNSIHEILEDFDLNYIVTTNYDNLIEKKLNELNDYDVIAREEELAYSKTNKMIIKMHGDIENKNIVLKKSDYETYEEKFPLITTFVKSLFTTNTILFLGYSMNDINVKNIMKWISDILKEDFRRVYLVEYNEKNILSNYLNEKNKLVNRISLECDSNDKKGEVLEKFLKQLKERKEEKFRKKNYEIYKILDYITENNLKKIKNDINVNQYETSEEGIIKGMILGKNIKINELDDIDSYKDIFLKAKIQKVITEKPDKIEHNLKIEESKNTNKIIESMMTYNKDEFYILEKDSNYNYLRISGFLFFQEFERAKEIIKDLLKMLEKENKSGNEEWY